MAKALKGLKGIRIFPVTKNDSTGYTVGTKVAITGAQSLSFSPETSEWKIYADDGVYDSGSDWQGMKFTLQLAEMPLDLQKHFEGGAYDTPSGVYTYKSDSQAPELAMSFAALQSDGTSRMVQIMSLKCSSYKNEYKTKGEGNDVTPITIEGTIMNRKKDNVVKLEKEAANDAALSWLDTIILPV
jgi:phi13 family phage major tail protein